MRMKYLLLISSMLLTVATSVRCQDGPLATRQASEIEKLVNNASELIEAQGRGAFPAFRQRGGPWRYGDVYLFMTDMNGVVIFNAAKPDREGKDLLEEHDADGKQFHKDFIRVVQRYGSGWVDYMFPKPGQATPSVKWSYVCGTTLDGTPALVGAGLYAE